MGTVFSLSKATTLMVLDISELALLACGLLLVVGLVGEYAESEPWRSRRKLFEMFVILGVAGELIGDGGIFTSSKHLQTIADAELAEAITNAGDAKKSADGAADDARRARASADKAKKAAADATTLAQGAHGEADSARKSTLEASAQLARLRTDAQSLEAGANKTKSELIDLAVCNAPRVITRWSTGNIGATWWMGNTRERWYVTGYSGAMPEKSYVDRLIPMAGQAVFIEYVPDAEARRAALNIVQTLTDAKCGTYKGRYAQSTGCRTAYQYSHPILQYLQLTAKFQIFHPTGRRAK
jgi:hypothetical protein